MGRECKNLRMTFRFSLRGRSHPCNLLHPSTFEINFTSFLKAGTILLLKILKTENHRALSTVCTGALPNVINLNLFFQCYMSVYFLVTWIYTHTHTYTSCCFPHLYPLNKRYIQYLTTDIAQKIWVGNLSIL